jgi:chaperonin GroEL
MNPEPPKKRVNTVDGRTRMMAGARVAYNAVTSTYGPRSANVAIKRPFGAPAVIHDGVNVLRSIFPLPDAEMDAGAEIVFDAASKTADIGDGTTLATLTTYEIAAAANQRIVAGARPMALREGIELATETVLAQLDKLKHSINVKKDAEKLLRVATVSAQVPDIGQMVAEAYKQLGAEAILTVEESRGVDSSLELKQGMQFDKGWITPYFVDPGNKLGESNLENVQILVTDIHLRDLEDFHEMMTRLTQNGVKHIAIIAGGYDPSVVSYFVKNHLKGAFKGVLIEAPAFGDKRMDLLKDIAIVTGAQFVSEGAGVGLQSVDVPLLGNAKRLTATAETTLIVDGRAAQEDVDLRAEEIKGQLKNTDLSGFDREKLQERYARLHSGIGVLIIGAKSEPEMKERKERAIDAIAAAKAALQDGILPGGGIAMMLAGKDAAKALEKQLAGKEFDIISGAQIIFKVCEAPFRKLLSNAGYDPGYYMAKLEDQPVGYGVDVMDGKVVDMEEVGIIDPAMVIKSALGYASSAAVAIATSDTLITDEPEAK